MNDALKTLHALIKEEIRRTIDEGDVIDASSRFKEKRADDLYKKIKSVADDVPNAIGDLIKNEGELNDKLSHIFDASDELFGGRKRARMMLAPIYANYGSDVSVLEALDDAYVSTLYDIDNPDPIILQTAIKFSRENQENLKQALADVRQRMADIEKEADSKRWVAPWRRYSQWSYTMQRIADVERSIKKLLQA